MMIDIVAPLPAAAASALGAAEDCATAGSGVLTGAALRCRLADVVSTGSLFDIEDLAAARGFAVFSAAAVGSPLAAVTGSITFLRVLLEALFDCMGSILSSTNKNVTICSEELGLRNDAGIHP